MLKKVASAVGILVGILALLVAVAQFIQSQQVSTSQDSSQAAQIAILEEQLHVQREMATLQAISLTTGPTATAVAKRIVELQSTAVALATKEARIEKTPTPAAAYLASGTLLFEENFEDEKIQGIGFSADSDWRIVADETGNKVFEIDNRNGLEYKGFSFGMDEWENYRVDYRARFLDSTRDKSEIGLQVRSNGYVYYVLILGEDETYLAYDIADGKGWTRLITQFPHLERNTWYKIRVDVQGELVSVYVNDTLWINVKGSRIQRGWVMMIAGADTHAQVDDIRVTELGQ